MVKTYSVRKNGNTKLSVTLLSESSLVRMAGVLDDNDLAELADYTAPVIEDDSVTDEASDEGREDA